MQTVDEQPDTIHLYVVREEKPKPPVFPIVLSALSLIVLLVFCVLVPYQQPVTRAVIRVPAVLLPPRTFTTVAPVIPTGVKIYPSTTAHGVLTITNGSVLTQTIPQGFRLGNVITDTAVFVPAGSANGYGYATVAAHSLISGKGGNFATLTINQVIGSSVYIRNLNAFSGGRNSYSVMVVTSKDRSVATAKARNTLLTISLGLHYPCNEVVSVTKSAASVTWRCQFVTYHIPNFYHITEVKLIGKNLIIAVWFVPRPIHVWAK